MAVARVVTRVEGVHKFTALSRRLKDAGRQDLRRELFRALNSATKGARAEVKARTPEFLPDKYAAVFTPDLKLSTSNRATGRGAGIRIRAKGKRNIRRPERGMVRHPLFGNRNHWFTTPVNKPGFFTDPLEEHADEIRAEILEAMERIANKIEG